MSHACFQSYGSPRVCSKLLFWRKDIRHPETAAFFFGQIAPDTALQFGGDFVDRTANIAWPQPGGFVIACGDDGFAIGRKLSVENLIFMSTPYSQFLTADRIPQQISRRTLYNKMQYK
ncbi:MAG: hypothetical protein LZF64_03210 [Nitrosomonas sp.]|nr:hypothetical protein [Nitrosomonas sp.]UJP00807.1 MAG: hypothetical protein LZF64_03210 [Nitrosomonas sp.]UJP02026.1 MAG: hypothetical protein LZF85_09545 [Nitrosomonas sp.]